MTIHEHHDTPRAARIRALRAEMRLPLIAAPMLLVSGPDLLIACSKAGVVGSVPLQGARTAQVLEDWLIRIEDELAEARETAEPGRKIAPYALNLVEYNIPPDRIEANLRLIRRFRPRIVITSFGKPGEVVQLVHDYGGLVFHDVATVAHAEKAIEAGVDGLIALTSGAGGHCGLLNPFAFVPQLRRIFDGAILLAGCISDGRSLRAAEVLGADFGYVGTRFIATPESLAPQAYRELMVSQTSTDVLTSDRISGVNATFLRGSLTLAGLDPDCLPPLKAARQPDLPEGVKGWRDIWSAGQGVGMVDRVMPVAEVVAEFEKGYRAAAAGQTAAI